MVLDPVTVISIGTVLMFDYEGGRFGILMREMQPGTTVMQPGDVGRLVLSDAFARSVGLLT